MLRAPHAATIAASLLFTAGSIGGCASFQRSQARAREHLLVTAGVSAQPAETQEARARLLALPRFEVVEQAAPDGAPQYVFPDPDNCCCLYVGDADQYARYKALEARVLRERSRDIETVLFGSSAMYADVSPDDPKLAPLPPPPRAGCPHGDS